MFYIELQLFENLVFFLFLDSLITIIITNSRFTVSQIPKL
jgi:hypothetical protein